MPEPELPLRGIRVIDAATLAAGPMVATMLGEFGAEVIKVEHPDVGDPLRTWGDQKDGVGLFWKSMSRNKQCVTLDLRNADGQDLFHRLLDVSDVFVANNRPSALAEWGLDYESVHAAHPRVVMLHISGYGLGGPKSDRPGFGTLAEAMSGFAHVTGQPDGPPTLPPFFLADGVASQSATAAVMLALYHRDVHGAGGQLIDVNLIEPLARLIETSTLAYSHLGKIPGRVGNLLPASAPRNAYQTSDGKWVAISSASPNIALRVFRAIDRPDMVDDARYADPVQRQARAVEIDALVAAWIESRTLDEVMDTFELAEVAAAPVYDAQQLLADEHLRARGSFVVVDDPDLGPMTVQAPVARFSETPGVVEHLGRALGADNDEVYGETARRGRRTPGRVAGGAGRSERQTGGNGARTPGPSFRAGHPGQQRAHVREGAGDWCRSRLPRPRGRLRAVGEGVGAGDRGRGADRPRLGPHRAGGPDQRDRHAVVPRRHHRDRHRGAGLRRRADRAQGPVRPRRLVGGRAARPARVEARAFEAHRPRGPDRRRRGSGPRRSRSRKSSDRLEALIFGAGDLSASLHARVDGNFDPVVDYPGDFWHYARAQVLTAARAGLVDAIDAPYPDYADPDGYRRSATAASALGFDGKWAIHPSQVPIANEVFSPTPAEVAEARASIAAYREAEAGGVGAIGRDGRLVDAAHMRLAANTLHKAELAGTAGADPSPLTCPEERRAFCGNALLIS